MTEHQLAIVNQIIQKINAFNHLPIHEKLNIAQSIQTLICNYVSGFSPELLMGTDDLLEEFFSDDEILTSFDLHAKKTLISAVLLEMSSRYMVTYPDQTQQLDSIASIAFISNAFRAWFFLSKKSPELYQYFLDFIGELPRGDLAISIAKHRLSDYMYEFALAHSESMPPVPHDISHFIDLEFERIMGCTVVSEMLIHVSIITNDVENIYKIYEINPVFNFLDEELYDISHLMMRFSRFELVRFLVENEKLNVNHVFEGMNNETLLHLAKSAENLDILKYLLEKGANPRSVAGMNETAFEAILLHHKNKENIIPILEIFFEKDPSLIRFAKLRDTDGLTPEIDDNLTLLEWICASKEHSNKLEIIQFLISKGAPIEHPYNHRTALHMIVNHYFENSALQLEILRYFLETLKIPISILEIDGHPSVLGVASQYFHKEMMEYLIKKGANIKHRDARKRTSFLLLIKEVSNHLNVSLEKEEKNEEIKNVLAHIEYLIEAGSDIHEKDARGNNALHLLLKSEEGINAPDVSVILEYLLKQGVSVLEENSKDETPLMVCINASLEDPDDCCNLNHIPLLLQYGANIEEIINIDLREEFLKKRNLPEEQQRETEYIITQLEEKIKEFLEKQEIQKLKKLKIEANPHSMFNKKDEEDPPSSLNIVSPRRG